VLASVIGNGLEWYDYMIYGFFAALVAGAFFPSSDALAAQMAVFGAFAISFIVRPIAGVAFGIYADKVGRKPALTIMIMLMAVATIGIGVTPSYAAIGVAAPIIIVLARILQGISVGGEFASATAMLTEFAPRGKRMLFGSFQMCSQAFATLLAAVVGVALATSLSDDALAGWGWRIPFLLGGVIAPIGLYIRTKVDESPAFAEMKATDHVSKAPLREVFSNHMGGVVAGIGLVVIGTTSNYVWFIYLTVFVEHELSIPFATILLSDAVAGGLLFLWCPIAGRLADAYGGARIFIGGVIGFAGLAVPLMSYVIAEPSFERLLTVQVIMTVPIAMIWGPTPGLFAGLFPTEVRTTGMSVAYNTGVLLFGGLAPFYLTVLQRWVDTPLLPALYIVAAGLVSLVLLASARQTVMRASRQIGRAHV